MPQLALQTDYNQRIPYKTAYDFNLAYIRSRHRASTGVHFSNYAADHGLLSPGQYSLRDINLAVQTATAPYLIGVELEVEGVESRSRLIDALSRIKGEYVLVRDGSLDSSGAEIVTLPIDPDKLVSSQWYQTLKAVSSLGVTSYDTGRCGLHLSVGKSYLKSDTWSALQRFLTKHKVHFQHISQRKNYGYCEFKNGVGKYRALNLDKSSVAEFRFFRGNLKPEKFFAAVETIRALVESAKTAEMEGKRLTWQRYAKTVEQYKYAKTLFDAAPVLIRAERSESNSRPRRTMTDIAMSVAQRINARWVGTSQCHRLANYTSVYVEHATNEIIIRAGASLPNSHLFDIGRGEHQVTIAHESITWRYFPRYLTRDIDRLIAAGWKFRAIISSDVPLKTNLRLQLSYSVGAFGRHSRITPYLSTTSI
jgi:hypothetical protein